jgi:chorismate lyase/3-hydroxybenzoate synthase
MGDAVAPPRHARAIEVEYRALPAHGRLGDDVLAVVGFGRDAGLPEDPRAIHIALEPLLGAGLVEVWHGVGPVQHGRHGAIRYASDGERLFGVLEVNDDGGDLAEPTRAAYDEIARFQAASGYAHLLRVWNHFDAINAGAGDAERYRRFCVGRAAALATLSPTQLPAATAIGHQGTTRRLQIHWLAASGTGVALENPRQVSAYRYPRQYGPASPSFSRAMLAPGGTLLISGTASVVGHRSEHDEVAAQLAETLTNLDSIVAQAVAREPRLPARLGSGSLVKAYVRDRSTAARVIETLGARLPRGTPLLVLAADICRADLLIEIDAVHGTRRGA